MSVMEICPHCRGTYTSNGFRHAADCPYNPQRMTIGTSAAPIYETSGWKIVKRRSGPLAACMNCGSRAIIGNNYHAVCSECGTKHERD